MRSHTIPLMTLVIGMLCAPVVTRAADNARPVRIDIEPGALAAGTNGVEAGPALAVGAGYALTDSFEVGGHVQTAADVRLFDRSVGYTSVTGGGRYYVLGRAAAVQPWLIGQAGWYQGTISVSKVLGGSYRRTENGGGVNMGAGFDVPVGNLVSLGTDVRWHQTIGVFDNAGFLTTMATVAFHFGS
jgi:hypothetical protein